MDPNPRFVPAGTPMRRRKTDQGAMNPIEATVTKLLVATKQLLEGLTLWSTRKMTEEQVSDIFVQLATQFNMASQSFHEVGIDTSELAHIPDDLRNCLETALGEEPSPSSLDQYLPRIKEVIINLLQGLRLKQNLYREQTEAKSARLQPSVSATGRVRSSGSHSRQPGVEKAPEPEVTASRTQSLNTGPAPTLSVSSPRDEQGHAETLASLRKSDAITRRASSRRHSQRFSTLLEQNAPPVPRRNPMMDPSMLSTYSGYGSSQGSTPITSPNMPMPNGQFPPPTYDPYPTSPALSTASMNQPMDAMSMPPTVPMPPLPKGASQTPSSATSPLLGSSSMMPSTLTTEVAPPSHQLHPTNGSTETVNNVMAPATSNVVGASSALSLMSTDAPVEPIDSGLTLFLQVGKSVKKTKFEGELTHSGLRMLFMEKFQYNPGQEDFPTIYVKDPHTNIHYELESLADVKQNAFLSLNVDDLENIQRKMDQGFAALTKELYDIKKAQEASEAARQKAAIAAAAAAAVANTPAERSTPSNSESTQMLRSVVQKVVSKNKLTASPVISPSAESSASGRVSAADLKPHQDEVRSLRRDLGIVRQLYTELQSETKEALGQLAGYTGQIRKQALEQPLSSRLFIETGKVQLDKKSEDLTNKIEELQDVVEDMKVNVTQRRGRPSDKSIAFVDKQCEEVGAEITELADFIQTIRPSWKKTWEIELQTIVKEQMFLKEQEALLEDLKEDRSSLLQTLTNLKKVMELQSKNGGLLGGRHRDFVFQPAEDEGFEGLKTVMEEVKMIEPDSNRRLRAMAQMEKLRHIELSNRIDEFEEELTTFVGSSKLRKTGGAMEVERQRQQRDLENLRAMFGKKDQRPSLPIDNNAEPEEVSEMVEEENGDVSAIVN
ncbi:Bud site selection protein 6 [Haplosporangium sp. Z 767]|nr:Bud site selection protein 6 [Haplosporangium sp. Z 767]